MMASLTRHAIDRYIERVDPSLSIQAARAALMLHAPVIKTAADFRCGTVLLGSGARLVLDGERVVTVLPRKERR